MPKSKSITIEDLATMVQKGFQEAHDKMDLELGAIRADIRDIKGTLGPLVSAVSYLQKEHGDWRLRLGRVERKVGVGPEGF